MRRLLAVALAALMVVSIGGSALAAPPFGLPPGQAKRVTVRERTEFPDIGAAVWAEKHIRTMVLKGVFKGYDDGTFQPNGAVSRTELIVLAVRVMGLEEEALDRTGELLAYRDWSSVPAWATGYMVVAHEQGLLYGLLRESGNVLQANASASRLVVAVTLIRAMGRGEEAAGLAGTSLPFVDADLIPAWASGYVALALAEGIIRGYENGTFRPNQPVSRAEMAAMLDRWDGGAGKPGDQDREFKGTILAIATGDEPTLTVANSKFPAGRTFRVDEGALIYLNDAAAGLEDLYPGDVAELILDEEEEDLAVFIAAYYAVGKVTGTVAGLGETALSLLVDGVETAYPLHPDVRVLDPEGEEQALSCLEAGFDVEITLARGRVTLIRILEPDAEEEADDEEDEEEQD